MSTPHRQGESGTSLIELLIGTVVLVAMIVPTVSVCVQNSRLRRLDAEIELAFAACRNRLEEARALPFATIPTLHGRGFEVPGPNGIGNGLAPRAGDADGLPGEFEVTTVDTSGAETLYRVRAISRWQGVLGDQELQLDVFMTNRS